MEPHVAASSSSVPRQYVFEDVVLDTGQRRVWLHADVLPLSKLTFDLLLLLAQRAPNLVSHDEAAEKVWGPRRVVSPETLAQTVLRLRHRLGDSAASPRYIESVRGEGYRLAPRVTTRCSDELDVSGNVAHRPRRALGRVVHSGVLAALLLVTVWLAWDRFVAREMSTAPASPAAVAEGRSLLPNSIAVLPFETLDAGPEDGGLVRALHAGLINDLGRTGTLKVIARASVLHYTPHVRSISDIASELNVQVVLQGSLHRFGAQRRVMLELIEARDGTQLWSKDYAADAERLWTLRQEMTADVARALESHFALEQPLDGGTPLAASPIAQ